MNNNVEVNEVAVADLCPNKDTLIPRYCPIDGSPLVIIEGTLVCEAESHNWELALGGEGFAEFYKLELTGY